MPNQTTGKNAVLYDDLDSLDRLITTSPDPSSTSLDALRICARLSRPVPFSHLLANYPDLIPQVDNASILFAALDGNSVPIWRIILTYRPDAKNQRFGHLGTVVERCVMAENQELLEFWLSEGARVEQTGRPILLRAKICGANEEIKEILLKYGATTDLQEDE